MFPGISTSYISSLEEGAKVYSQTEWGAMAGFTPHTLGSITAYTGWTGNISE